MKIEGSNDDADYRGQRVRELRDVLNQPQVLGRRVCLGCGVRCPGCGSTICTCNCAPDCPDAPRYLSSEPEAHPVEPAIVALVYALNTLSKCSPCWSCEGHMDSAGRLIRPPQIWFYARATVHLSLINHTLFRLHVAGSLSCEWQVRVVDWGQKEDTAFSLEPALNTRDVEKADLTALQRDAAAIARGLNSGVREAAEHYLANLAPLLTL